MDRLTDPLQSQPPFTLSLQLTPVYAIAEATAAHELSAEPASAAMQGRSLVAVGDVREVEVSGGQPHESSGDYIEDEEREVEDRLRALGYLP